MVIRLLYRYPANTHGKCELGLLTQRSHHTKLYLKTERYIPASTQIDSSVGYAISFCQNTSQNSRMNY